MILFNVVNELKINFTLLWLFVIIFFHPSGQITQIQRNDWCSNKWNVDLQNYGMELHEIFLGGFDFKHMDLNRKPLVDLLALNWYKTILF